MKLKKLTYKAQVDSGVLGWRLLEVHPASVVAPVRVVQRLDDQERGDHLGPSLGPGKEVRGQFYKPS